MSEPKTETPKSSVVENAIALYAIQFCRKLVPLITIPYLARTLGPASWGTVAFVLAMASFLSLFMEFGFDLSATREIARQRNNRHACSEVMAGVIGVQCCLF